MGHRQRLTPAEPVAHQSQHYHLDTRPQSGEGGKQQKIHANEPGRQGNVLANSRQQPSDEGADMPVIGENARVSPVADGMNRPGNELVQHWFLPLFSFLPPGRCHGKSVAAPAPAEGYLLDVLIIDGKYPAGLRATPAVNKAQTLPGQQGAGDEQGATGAALTALSCPLQQLTAHVVLSEVDEIEPPALASQVGHKAGLVDELAAAAKAPVERTAQHFNVYAMHGLPPLAAGSEYESSGPVPRPRKTAPVLPRRRR
jgi:hypothetical protein